MTDPSDMNDVEMTRALCAEALGLVEEVEPQQRPRPPRWFWSLGTNPAVTVTIDGVASGRMPVVNPMDALWALDQWLGDRWLEIFHGKEMGDAWSVHIWDSSIAPMYKLARAESKSLPRAICEAIVAAARKEAQAAGEEANG